MGKGKYIASRMVICTMIIISMVATSTMFNPNNVDASTSKTKKINKVVQTAKKMKGKSIRSFPSYFHSGRWCADFVNWTFRKSKLNNNKTFPKNRKSSVSSLMSWYKKKGLYKKNTKKFVPKKGDLVFLSSSSHVGIVAKASKKYVYIIHGNWSNKVKYTKLKKNGYTSSQRAKIKGFARVKY